MSGGPPLQLERESPSPISARRKQPKTAGRERTRQKILQATFELIGHERGLSVRIEEICANAQISRGSFYNYFSSLEELFEALAFDLNQDFTAAVQATMRRCGSAAERANAAMRYYLERARGDARWGWAMVHISSHGPLFGASTSASALAIVMEGIDTREFDLEDARFGRDMILGTCLAAMVTQLREGAPEAQPKMLARHILRSLGVPHDRVEEIVARPLPPPSLDPVEREAGA